MHQEFRCLSNNEIVNGWDSIVLSPVATFFFRRKLTGDAGFRFCAIETLHGETTQIMGGSTDEDGVRHLQVGSEGYFMHPDMEAFKKCIDTIERLQKTFGNGTQDPSGSDEYKQGAEVRHPTPIYLPFCQSMADKGHKVKTVTTTFTPFNEGWKSTEIGGYFIHTKGYAPFDSQEPIVKKDFAVDIKGNTATLTFYKEKK